MQTSFTRVASMTHELATITQRALEWLPSVLAGRGSSAELRDHCHLVRRHMARVRRNHKEAWECFALLAGKEGFSLWNGDRTDSAHQAVATIAHRIYQLLGGRSVVRPDGPMAPAQLLRLQLHLHRSVQTLLPGFDLTHPTMPKGLFQALAWENHSARDAIGPLPLIVPPKPRSLHQEVLLAHHSEWEAIGPERQAIFRDFHSLHKPEASAKEILGHRPSKSEQYHLQQLVKRGHLRKPKGRGKNRRGYCLGRVPTGFPEQPRTDAG